MSSHALPYNVTPTSDLSVDAGQIWEFLADSLQIGLGGCGESARVIEAAEEGLHVATFGLAQIIRQSREHYLDVSEYVLKQRLLGAQRIFEAIEQLPPKKAINVEVSHGFHSRNFATPTEELIIDELRVATPSGFEHSVTGRRGCPFRSFLPTIYPDLADAVLRTVG